MNNNLHYGINFSVRPINVFQTIGQQINQVTTNTQNMTNNFGEAWKKLLSFNQALEGIRNLKSILREAIQPGIALNTSLMDLSAITGLTGKGLNAISDAARVSAKVFGTDAAQNVESYKLLLSQLSPDIAKNAEAMKAMGNHVNILSKTMGGNTIAATEVLATAMNQYGVSLDDPMQASKAMAEMMNVMAAAAKEGSAELPQIKSALENVGMVAKTTGVTFSETNAAIQVLDKAGKKGAEGGVALRNALSILSEGRFLPRQTRVELEAAGISIAQLADKTIPLTSRLNALKPVINDTALITKLFGKENAAAAIALINGSEDIDAYNRKIQGTSTAVEQAGVVMNSTRERLKRVSTFFDDIKISLYNLTEGALPFAKGAMILGTGLTQMGSGVNTVVTLARAIREQIGTARVSVKAFSSTLRQNTSQTKLFAFWQKIASKTTGSFRKAINGLRNSFLWATGAVRTFSIAVANIPVLGWIAVAVAAVTAAVVYLWENCRRFREILFGIWEVSKLVFGKLASIVKSFWNNTIKPVFLAIGNFIGQVFTDIGNTVSTVFTGIWSGLQSAWTAASSFFSGLWQDFKNTFSGFAGFVDEWIVQPIAGAFSGLWTVISGVFSQIWAGLKSLFAPIVDLWNKIFPDDSMKEIGLAWKEGQKKGGIDFDNSKKKEKEEGDEEANTATLPGLSTLTPGKGGLKGFGTAAANAAKNTPSATEKLGSLSSNNQAGTTRSLTINKLVETLIVKVERLPESKERIKDAVSEALLLAVNDYNLAT